MQQLKNQDIQVTAGIAQPTDLTGQMVAALVSGAMVLGRNGELSSEMAKQLPSVIKNLYWVTMNTMGVVEHPRTLWTSDSFYDDRAWAVRSLPAAVCGRLQRAVCKLQAAAHCMYAPAASNT